MFPFKISTGLFKLICTFFFESISCNLTFYNRAYRKECIDEMQDRKYEEQVPEWILDELALGEYGSGYEMCCPNCDGTMVEKSKYNKS